MIIFESLKQTHSATRLQVLLHSLAFVKLQEQDVHALQRHDLHLTLVFFSDRFLQPPALSMTITLPLFRLFVATTLGVFRIILENAYYLRVLKTLNNSFVKYTQNGLC